MGFSKLLSSFVKALVASVFSITLSQQKIVRDFVNGLSYGDFAESDNQRLNTDILQFVSVRNLTECEGKCLINRNCFSGNFGKDKNQHGEHGCQLLAGNKFTSAQQMTVDNSFQHFSVASPCDQKPCKYGGKCVPMFENNSYACQCPRITQGQHCEKVHSGMARLVNGTWNGEGRVEVFYFGKWGTVCDDKWDQADADVVCRQLGFSGASSFPCCAHYGQGNTSILMDEVKCRGTESDLGFCPHNGWRKHNCKHNEDASVVCEVAALMQLPDLPFQ